MYMYVIILHVKTPAAGMSTIELSESR